MTKAMDECERLNAEAVAGMLDGQRRLQDLALAALSATAKAEYEELVRISREVANTHRDMAKFADMQADALSRAIEVVRGPK